MVHRLMIRLWTIAVSPWYHSTRTKVIMIKQKPTRVPPTDGLFHALEMPPHCIARLKQTTAPTIKSMPPTSISINNLRQLGYAFGGSLTKNIKMNAADSPPTGRLIQKLQCCQQSRSECDDSQGTTTAMSHE